jgi:hypothetical protein
MSMSSGTVDFFYVRHAKSESNLDGDAGVHIYDPLLMGGNDDVVEPGESYGKGRSYCEGILQPEFAALEPRTHIAVSALARCIQTMMLSVPLDTLRTAKITIMPILVEQTEWMSDRARSVRQIRMIIEAELKARVKKENGKLFEPNINFGLLFSPDNSLKTSEKELERFEKGQNRTNEEMAELEKTDELRRPWHTKTGLYSVARVQERATEALKTLAFWAKIAQDHAGTRNPPQFAVFGHGGIINYMDQLHGDIGRGSGRLTSWAYGQTRNFRLSWKLVDGNMTTERLVRVEKGVVEKIEDLKDEERKETEVYKDINDRAGKTLREHKVHGQFYKDADEQKKNPEGIPGLDDAYLSTHLGGLAA